MDFYHKIYEFCKIRNLSSARQNGLDMPPRVNWIIDQLIDLNISYILDIFQTKNKDNNYYNIILPGLSNRIVTAHHDIVNKDIDNANDNSCSVINAIALKQLVPSITIVLLDGEECGGIGSQRLSEQIVNDERGNVEWVLNLELTGRGGKYFFIGDYPGKLSTHIKSLFNCPIKSTPFNDSVIFRENGIDSCVINPLPYKGRKKKLNENTNLDYSLLYNCHNKKDTIDTISPKDMKVFTEEVLRKIVTN